jgi:hypothetical protein
MLKARPVSVSLGWLALVVVACGGCERSTAPALSFNRGNAEDIRRLLQQGSKGAGEAAVAATAEPDGWSTLKGRFTLNGTPPPRAPLTVDKDLSVCAPPGMRTLDESVVTGPGGGIQNVLIYLTTPIPTDNPKWLHESYEPQRNAEVPFDQKNCVFLSHVGSMWVAQRLKVLNSDPVGHNTNLDSKRGAKGENFLVAANSFAYYEPGKASPAPFPVSCSIHPWMKAWMMVCESPYFAVTGEDGSFEIQNLPAGVPLEFRVWQEKLTFVQQVTVDGSPAKWNRGRYSVTLTKDAPKEMSVVLEGGLFN